MRNFHENDIFLEPLASFQTCTDISFRQPLKLNIFGDLDTIIKAKSQRTKFNGILYL